jgi:hypothetical protein
MDMCLNVWYRLDLRGKLKFGGTSEGVLIDAFSDGRLCSVVMEHVLPEYFQNLVRCSSNGARFDLKMVTDVPWMFRTIELKCNTTSLAPPNFNLHLRSSRYHTFRHMSIFANSNF